MSLNTGNYSEIPKDEAEYREMISGPFGVTLDYEGNRLERPQSPFLSGRDSYNNEYWISNGVMEVVPDVESFEEQLKSVITFANNFYTLRTNGVNIPDFESGVELRHGKPTPYFLACSISGEPPADTIPEEIARKIEDINETGRELSMNKQILYTKPFLPEDFVITDENSCNPDEPVVQCPGTYEEDFFETQIENSDLDISIEEIEEMTDMEFWR